MIVKLRNFCNYLCNLLTVT